MSNENLTGVNPAVTTRVVYDGGVFLGPIFGDMLATANQYTQVRADGPPKVKNWFQVYCSPSLFVMWANPKGQFSNLRQPSKRYSRGCALSTFTGYEEYSENTSAL